MAKTIVQELVVTMSGDAIFFLPATSVTQVQDLSVVRANDEQTVVLQPVS